MKEKSRMRVGAFSFITTKKESDMSLEQAKACIEKMKSDASFRKDVISL